MKVWPAVQAVVPYSMNNSVLHITLLFSVLIAIIIIYFFVSIVRYHRRYVKLQRERTNAEITIQENERRRIANDLHDSFGSILSAVKMNITNIETGSAEDAAIIAKSAGHLDDIITNLRRISHNLLPNTLERKGLAEALREAVQNMQHPNGLHIQLTVPQQLAIAPAKSIHVFRILQEIMYNTVKHAQANNLHIHLTEEKDGLHILTTDDGKGFDVAQTKEEGEGLGLKSIHSRVELLGGKLTLESQQQKGTVHAIQIPY